MLWDIFIGQKKTPVKVFASNAPEAVTLFLKSHYGKGVPVNQVIAWKSKKTIKNPSCEYCHLLQSLYVRAGGPKDKRHIRARLKLHYKAMHRNPPSSRKIKAMKRATRLAYKVYTHIKQTGVVLPLPARTPRLVKKYVKFILDANDIRWAESNGA